MNIIYRVHTVKRMFERDISKECIEDVLNSGEVIEEYLDDKPYPSFLLSGFCENRPTHIVFSKNEDELIIITVYEPDPKRWSDDFRKRV